MRLPVLIALLGRNEAVLTAARAKHGEEFVRWVLAHEDSIVATLRTDR